MKIENLNVRLEKYQKSKTACVKITSCPFKAVVLQNIPKVSSPIYTVQYLKAPKPGWSEFAKISSRIQIQTIQLIHFETLFPNPLPPTNSLISVDLPSEENEFSSVEFDIPVIKR
uniref:Uncharacterized protein n=1 Tax=Panagrolaimus davidi TaxID=227884 RepID=A0A914QZ01_9BILA